MTAEVRIAQLEQENVQLRAEFCQISNLILAQKSEFWYADLIMRRCQILQASSCGERVAAIARLLGCDDQTVRNVIHEFNDTGLAVLQEGSSRPHRLHSSFSEEGLERLRDLPHRSPRDFSKERGLWTLELAAQVSLQTSAVRSDGTPAGNQRIRAAQEPADSHLQLLLISAIDDNYLKLDWSVIYVPYGK